MDVENILFDLDGTLVDSLPGIQFSAREAVQAVLPGEKTPDLRAFIGPPIRRIFEKVFPRLPSPALDALESCFRQSYDREGYRKGILYAGVRSTLASLLEEGVSMFLVTNKPLGPTSRILAHTAISEFFREAISPDSVHPPFGDKSAMAEYLLRKFLLARERTLLVGDSADDRKAAEHCGMRFGAAAYGYGGVRVGPAGPPGLLLWGLGDLLGMVRGKMEQRKNPAGSGPREVGV
jgi:phosphoglycolate phosphatase